MANIEEKLQKLAKAAAQIDSKEGGYRVGLNIAAQLQFALQTKQDHKACGKLTLYRNQHGHMLGIHCPSHGIFKAPEWKERETPS